MKHVALKLSASFAAAAVTLVGDGRPARRTALPGGRQHLACHAAGGGVLQVVFHRQERAQAGADHGSFLGSAPDLYRRGIGLAVLQQERHDRHLRAVHAEMAAERPVLSDPHQRRHAFGAGRLHRYAGIVRRRNPHPGRDRFQGRQGRALDRLLGRPLIRRREPRPRCVRRRTSSRPTSTTTSRAKEPRPRSRTYRRNSPRPSPRAMPPRPTRCSAMTRSISTARCACASSASRRSGNISAACWPRRRTARAQS